MEDMINDEKLMDLDKEANASQMSLRLQKLRDAAEDFTDLIDKCAEFINDKQNKIASSEKPPEKIHIFYEQLANDSKLFKNQEKEDEFWENVKKAEFGVELIDEMDKLSDFGDKLTSLLETDLAEYEKWEKFCEL